MSKKSDPIKVGIKKGTFYLSQNEDGGSGWERQEFTNPQTNQPMVKFHKKISIEGNVIYLGMKEDKFKGNCLSMLVKNDSEDVTYSLEIPIKDTKGIKATNQYFNSLVGALENIKKGDKVTMFVNNKNLDKNDNLYRNIVTLDQDGKLIKSNFSFSDVPRWDSKEVEDEFGKKVVEYDPSPSNKFYISKFMEVVEKFKSSKSETPNTESKPATTTPDGQFETVDTESKSFTVEHDDLPF